MFSRRAMVEDPRMTARSLTDDAAPATGLGRRARLVLDHLVSADEPQSAAQVADGCRLHLNTARFHLDALVSRGVADRFTEERATPGRPRILYAARTRAAGPHSYRLLARMLGGIVASLDGDGAAVAEAGRAWGRELVGPVAPSHRVDADAAARRLTVLLDEVGFDPEMDPGAATFTVLIRHCPFAEVVAEHGTVVCGLHLGLMEGALDELGAPLEVDALEPLVAPSLCVTRLAPPAASGSGR